MKNIAEFLAAKRFHDPEQIAAPESGACLNCGATLADYPLYGEFRVCGNCRFHYSLGAHRRIELLVDPGSFHEGNRALISIDPIGFRAQVTYKRRFFDEQRRTGLADAVVTGTGRIAGRKAVFAAVDFRFMGGSIGCAVGEKLALAYEQGARSRLPVVTVIASSGVRMQEGILALMQLAKVVGAAGRLAAAGQLHVVVLATPSLGGAYAVLANLADVIVAEPLALIGYASTRAIDENAHHAVQRSRTAETQFAHGLIDQIVDRTRLRDFLSSMLEMLASRAGAADDIPRPEFAPAAHNAWGTIQLARHAERPTAVDYIGHFSDTFIEIRGDRAAGDDRAIVCGIGMLGGEAVVYVAHERQRGAAEAAQITPQGFRKAQRGYQIAAKLRLPLITLIDSAVVAPTLGAELAGVGAALTGCMQALSTATTPVIAAVIGEARGEAALALGIADRVLMLENAVFEVVAPETAASILYRDVAMADSVATSLRPTANDCKTLGIIDTVVPEPMGGAHADHEAAARLLSAALLSAINELKATPGRKLVRARYQRARRVGQYTSFLSVTVGQGLAEFGGEIAHLASDALARLKRRARSRSAGMDRTIDEDAGGLVVP
jgi:acetyl-CoA carboxylase carboxyl transferase alpha subunit/acetyl-CoA carboxylase carboxyl transferase beta subunit